MHFGLWITNIPDHPSPLEQYGEHARAPLPPWTVEEYRGISYIVRDANNFPAAYIYSSRSGADVLLDAPRA